MDARIARRFVHVIGVVLAIGIAARTPAAAATLPTGFTESQVASGLASPTAMQFAPDGRLFVCEQGGRLRVIKNGALLPTPFVTLTVNASGERGLLGVAFDPAFAAEPVRVCLLHGDHADCSQSHQPLHRERRRRPARQRGRDPRPRQPQRGHQPQRRRARLRSRREAVRGRRRERQRRQRADAREPARQDAPPQQRRHHSRPTTRSTPRRPAGTAPSGRSACATRSPSRSIRTARRCSSTTSGRTRGKRSTTVRPARTTAGPTPRARRATRDSCRRATPTRTRAAPAARSPAAPSTRR